MNKYRYCLFYTILICILSACTKEESVNIQEGVPLPEYSKRLSFVENDSCLIENISQILKLAVDCNIDYSIKLLGDTYHWIEQVTDISNTVLDINATRKPILCKYDWISLNISENTTNRKRYAEVMLYNEQFNLSDTLCITQEGRSENAPHEDGEYLCIQESTKGNGVDLIIMGDGFTRQDMALNGRYETVMKQAADYFFSIEPFKSYRDYFNIYMVIAESEEAGVGTENYFGGAVNNKFGTTFGSGTAITCNADLCFEYARKIKELPSNKPLTIIMPLNSSKYAGTTYLYANGNSIALCPMSKEKSPNDFEGLIHHEAGGHGFGFLCDEYVYYKQEMPENRKKDLKEWQKLGFQMNLDFTNDPSSILWKDFIGLEKYRQVGTYEGGYEYQYGVWRSETNSCMNNNIPYFNVQSRWSIVSRIMKLAEIKGFIIQDFISTDNVTPLYKAETYDRASDMSILPPLGCPKWIK